MSDENLVNSDMPPELADNLGENNFQAYDSVVEAGASGNMTGTMLGGKKKRKRRTRGKRHTLKKAHKVKSRKLKSRRSKRRRGKRSRRRSKRRYKKGGGPDCTSGTTSYAVGGNTLQASESMFASPPSVFPH